MSSNEVLYFIRLHFSLTVISIDRLGIDMWIIRMLVSGIFKQLRTFVVVPDVISKFSKIENLFFFRGSVR